MATLLQQTRTTRSGTRVVTTSSSIGSLRSAAKTPVQQDAKAKHTVQRDSRPSPIRTDFRSSLQKEPRSKTPVLREPRSRRDLAAAVAAAAAAAPIASPPLPTSRPHSPAVSTLSISNVGGLRSPSPGPPLDGMLEGPSPLALFVTNIKLLNLDSLPDWPRININTFVPPGPGTQGQKRRVHCAEWVFFQLFSLWDPAETENRLKPLYPPQDPDQSAEYRAALFKALERAKKMGALSRDAIVRKSALEDCKADRLEEILASFSTTVLKKVVIDRLAVTGARPDSILGFATQNLGRQADRSELTAMTMAYRSSIKKVLGQKEGARKQFRDFANLLDVKEQETARRHEAILAKEINGTGQPVSHNARAEMRRTLRNNWSGDEAWMEALFSGDAKEAGLMTRPFDDIWSGLQQGLRLSDFETGETGLLQQLEGRVRMQKERLQKWNAFRQDTFGRTGTRTPSHAKAARPTLRGIDLGFENHMNLQVGKMARLSLKNQASRVPGMSAEYARLVSDLNQDLARISKKDLDLSKLLAACLPKKVDKAHRRHRSTFSIDGDSAASEISDLDDAEKTFSAEVHQPTSFPDRLTGSCGKSSLRPKLSRPDLTSIAVEGSSGPAIPLGKLNFPGKSAYDIDQFDLIEPPTPPQEAKPATPPSLRRTTSAHPRDVKSASPTSKRRSAPPSPGTETRTTTPLSKGRKPRRLDMDAPSNPLAQDQAVTSPSQYFADEDVPEPVQGILSPSSVKDSPTPIRRTKPRHTLSILERKQLSLSRKSSFFLEDDEPDLVHEPPSICGSTAEHTAEEDSKESGGEMTDEHSARALHEDAKQAPVQHKPPHQLRRCHRRALTLPQKQTMHFPEVEADAEEGGDRLFERLTMEQDYEAVFRSRPKIAQTSPVKGYGLSDYFA